MRSKMFIIMTAVMLWSGCAGVISKDVLKEVNRKITFGDLRKDTLAYLGETVLLGGVVVKVIYELDHTLLELYQTEMDWEKRPENLDRSEGRFLAQYDGFLDSEIYQKGRSVTVAGIVQGVKTMKLGETDYRYPFLIIRGIHLWEKEKPLAYDPYPWYPIGPWGRWGPWGPWYYPYWRY